jgi:hypothetical protein
MDLSFTAVPDESPAIIDRASDVVTPQTLDPSAIYPSNY